MIFPSTGLSWGSPDSFACPSAEQRHGKVWQERPGEKPSRLQRRFTSEKRFGKAVGQRYSYFLTHPKEAALTFTSQFSSDPLSFP